MSAPKPSPIVRLLPSLADLAFLMPVVFLFARLDGARHLLGDGDTGWHIRTGEWILQNGRVPDRDLFSYTKAGEPWYAWEWLWDVVFAWLHQHGGMAAVVLASVLVISLCSALLYRLAFKKCGDPLIAIAVTFLAGGASTVHWLARPHLFTLLFVLVFFAVLEAAQAGRTRLLLWLPPLTVLWTNLHGGFFVGLVLLAIYAAGELMGGAVAADGAGRRAALARARPYGLCALACLLASLVNPYTYRLHLHIASYLADGYHFKNIIEFLSVDFHHPATRYFEPMLLAGAVVVAVSLRRGRFTHALLLAGWAHLALVSVRNVPIFMLLCAPIVAVYARELLGALARAPMAQWLRRGVGRLESFSAEIAVLESVRRTHMASAAAMILLAILVYGSAGPPKFQASYDPKRYPVAAVELLRSQQPGDKVFTNDDWGDYLIYRLYPDIKVFIDGRSDFYGARIGAEYIDVMNGRFQWGEILKRHGTRTVVLPADASLASTLKQAAGWRLVYDDGVAIVFRPATPEPERLQVSAAHPAEVSAIARSQNRNHVIPGSQQHPTRGE